jgi:hypothetical protein
MNTPETQLQQSTLVMKIFGWGLLAFPIFLFIYPPGFAWGVIPADFCIGPPHPPSPYDGLHPYIFMLIALYAALGILLIRGANDPQRNAGLFDFAILSSVLHALLMIPQAFYYPNEHAHLWADVPFLIFMAYVFWKWHPTRARG